MIRTIIVDDEPLALKLLQNYSNKIEQIKVLASFTNPIEALNFLQKEKVDLIFLDIQMPELNGLNLAKLIGNETKIIFTTAYSDHAVDGFELKALDYIVKPISLARFLDAVSRFSPKQQNIAAVDTTLAKSLEYMFVKTEYRKQRVDFSEINYLQGMGDYCAIILNDSKIMTLEKMRSFEVRLPRRQFLRVHKSYIVALDKINYVEKNRIKILDKLIPIGATYEAKVKEALDL